MKALARRASDRYATAHDLADDLEHFLASSRRGPDSQAVRMAGPPGVVGRRRRTRPATREHVELPALAGRGPEGHPARLAVLRRRATRTSSSACCPARATVTGCRIASGSGRPASSRPIPSRRFPWGCSTGRPGCGKSSLVKAGLAPLLADHVLPVYVEATADRTEARLLAALAKLCPDLPQDEGLPALLASLRRGQALPSGRKVLIVLDQFEQWLHARRQTPEGELVEALRQCDGARVQCLVLVRDDFWMAATRFMGELEVPLVEGHNSAAVDLFPVRHAEKVLAAFGRAFGALPDVPAKLGREHRHFLEQAVAGLAQEGKVICVRLALFAQMMKDRPWTPASLRGVGGALGVGATFLEETFSARGAPPEHRLHQKAARAILEALLPNSGIDIKGHMRSRQDLLAGSPVTPAGRGDFEDLIHILDRELRLITPDRPGRRTEDEDGRRRAKNEAGPAGRPSRFIRAPSVLRPPPPPPSSVLPARARLPGAVAARLADPEEARDSARPGRAAAGRAVRPLERQAGEPLLASVVGVARPPPAHATAELDDARATMMRRAAGHHAAWGVALAAGLVLLLFAGREGLRPAAVPGIAGSPARGRDRGRARNRARNGALPALARWPAPQSLRERRRPATTRGGNCTPASACCRSIEDSSATSATGCLTPARRNCSSSATPCSPTRPRSARASGSVLEDMRRLPGERLRAACALAGYAAGRSAVAESQPRRGGSAGRGKRPGARRLGAGPAPGARDTCCRTWPSSSSTTGRTRPAAAQSPGSTATTPRACRTRSPRWKPRRAGELRARPRYRRARAAAAAAGNRGRRPGLARALAKRPPPAPAHDRPDGTQLSDRPPRARRSRCRGARSPHDRGRRGVGPPGSACWRSENLTRTDCRPPSASELATRLEELYRDDPDPGIHAVSGWLLALWGRQKRLAAIDHELARGKPVGARRWYVDSLGQTMVLIPPGRFERGTGPTRSGSRSITALRSLPGK